MLGHSFRQILLAILPQFVMRVIFCIEVGSNSFGMLAQTTN